MIRLCDEQWWRTNAWLLNFRRLVVRYERKLALYRAFVYIACALIALRYI